MYMYTYMCTTGIEQKLKSSSTYGESTSEKLTYTRIHTHSTNMYGICNTQKWLNSWAVDPLAPPVLTTDGT